VSLNTTTFTAQDGTNINALVLNVSNYGIEVNGTQINEVNNTPFNYSLYCVTGSEITTVTFNFTKTQVDSGVNNTKIWIPRINSLSVTESLSGAICRITLTSNTPGSEIMFT
jgi:hypothetical protein